MIQKTIQKIIQIWRTPEHLNQKVVRGSLVLYFGKFITKGFAFIRTLIIARLLLPQDIGLFGLGMLTISTTAIFFQTGFYEAIVQEKGDPREHMDSAWTVNIFVAMLLAVFLFFISAPVSAFFFHDPRLLIIVKFLSLMTIIQMLDNIGIVLLQKDLKFNVSFLYNTIGYVSQLGITIIFAFYLRNYWALVLGAVLGKVVFLILSYIYSPYRPKLNFSLKGARYLFRYGRWVGLGAIVLFFVNQGDYLTIGKMLDTASLAYYQVAFSLGTLPATEVVGVLGGLLFSLYANLQGETEKLRNVFYRISRLVFAISIPASVGLLVLSKQIVTFVYGSRWLPMVPILQVIVVYGLIKAFELITEPLFRGIGRPHISTFITAAQFGVMFAFIVPLTRMYGPVGTAFAVLFGFLVAQLCFLVQLKKYISISVSSLIKVTVTPVLASIGMAFLLVFMQRVFPVYTKIETVLYVLGGFVVYSLLLLLIDWVNGRKIYESLQWIKVNL